MRTLHWIVSWCVLKSFYLGFAGHSGFTLEPVSENSLTAVNFAHFPLTAQHQFQPVILTHVHSLFLSICKTVIGKFLWNQCCLLLHFHSLYSLFLDTYHLCIFCCEVWSYGAYTAAQLLHWPWFSEVPKKHLHQGPQTDVMSHPTESA